VIGKNLHLHGSNCIGNDGKTNACPVIGDNVSLGVGAKVLGNVTIANHIKIGAGAVVLHSFLEEGITVGGVPARKLK
jgi:serine O-acetyltransferase